LIPDLPLVIDVKAQTGNQMSVRARLAEATARAAGIGLRTPHLERFCDENTSPAAAWLEVHAENYFERGGIRHQMLLRIADRYPISVHGVALSLASPEGIDPGHLERLASLVEDVGACRVSEHLAWSRVGEVYYNDLLPLPLTEETLDVVSANVDRTQKRLGRTLLVENPSAYLRFEESTMSEATFLTRLTERTGCGLLLDVNNLFISKSNVGSDVTEWLATIPANLVGEIHLAGHEQGGTPEHPLILDTHDAPVSEGVWALYATALGRFGAVPTMIEWDSDVPALEILLGEAARAQRIMDEFAKA
jgi:uncharacterized protein (UPF0276 family)